MMKYLFLEFFCDFPFMDMVHQKLNHQFNVMKQNATALKSLHVFLNWPNWRVEPAISMQAGYSPPR